MNVSARPEHDATAPDQSAEQGAKVKAAAALLNQFARTLKTCRLYDANNPTVIRFRDEFGAAMKRTLAEHGPITYHFRSDDVLFGEVSLYPARSRDDNLALPFYRDGIRALTLNPGLEADEVEALLEAVLQVTGQNHNDDDLVTLLWEAHLAHIEVDYVPAEGEVGEGPAGAEGGQLVPWPTGSGSEPSSGPEGAATSAATEAGGGEGGATTGRSDDWSTGELTVEIEAGLAELESLAPSESARFRAEYEAEHKVPGVTTTIAISTAYLAAGAQAEDRAELGSFMPRVLRQAVTHGQWLEAREALRLLRQCGGPEWSLETFAQELLQPISIASAVERLDQQEQPAVLEFIALATEFGDPGVDWLNLVLAESQSRSNRRMLAESIAERCRANPERLAPWLSDPRWFVVRNVVHILGWIGGDSIVGLLQSVIRHPEPRVRHEAVAALGQVSPAAARPVLLRMLEDADTRMFCAVLHQLSAARDPAPARLLLSYMLDVAFEQRPVEEKRAIYSALSAVAGDEVVPELEAEMHRGNWFSRNYEAHRQAVARCIARIGTPLSRMVLERGVLSKRAPVRKACEDALTGFHDRE